MAAEVKKLEIPPTPAPDGAKPIKLRWFKTLATIGVRIDQLVQRGGYLSDGVSTTGYVESLTLYPGGNCVIELIVGYQQGVDFNKPKESYPKRYLVAYGGHGMSDWEDE